MNKKTKLVSEIANLVAKKIMFLKETINYSEFEGELPKASIKGNILYDLLGGYTSILGFEHDLIVTIEDSRDKKTIDMDAMFDELDSLQGRIDENRWYSARELSSWGAPFTNFFLGGILFHAYSMDDEINISNNFFDYYVRHGGSEPNSRPEEAPYFVHSVTSGFFSAIARYIKTTPQEWFLISGQGSFIDIGGIINTDDTSYPDSFDSSMQKLSEVDNIASPSAMANDLEVVLAGLRRDHPLP